MLSSRLFSQGSSADRSQWREPTRTSEGLCSLYEAALCLFEEVRLKTRHITDLRSVFFLNWLMFEDRAALKNNNHLHNSRLFRALNY